MSSKREEFLEAIRKRAFVRADEGHKIVRSGGAGTVVEDPWLFDFRAVMLEPKWLDAYAELFWEKYADTLPFQVCGLETAGIPLVAAIVMKSVERGTPVNGFFIRKSRKREGLLKAIEGRPTKDPVILVDDLTNSGGSLARQATTLADAGIRVRDAFTVLAFRAPEAYQALSQKNIGVYSLFSLTDFGIPVLSATDPEVPRTRFDVVWKFKAEGAAFEHVVPKSAPALDGNNLYFGSDAGVFYAIGQDSGKTVWSLNVGKHPPGKGIFSSPAIFRDTVYFGAYDGTVYALRAKDGSVRWTYDEADWIGSSPAIASDLGLLFIGLEFGLWRKRGGIAALDLATGKKKWSDRTPELTHCSPLYIPEEGMVVIGNNDGVIYAYDAQTGERRWTYQSGSDVKSSLAYDARRKLILFGSFDTKCYALRASDGSPAFAFQTGASIYSTPLVKGDTAYVASLDKHLYAIDPDTGKERFSFGTNGRIFASPILAEDSLWIGSNDGRLYELDPKNGKLRGFFQATERIVNKIAYNADTKRFFVPTVANEIYCLTKK